MWISFPGFSGVIIAIFNSLCSVLWLICVFNFLSVIKLIVNVLLSDKYTSCYCSYCGCASNRTPSDNIVNLLIYWMNVCFTLLLAILIYDVVNMSLWWWLLEGHYQTLKHIMHCFNDKVILMTTVVYLTNVLPVYNLN